MWSQNYGTEILHYYVPGTRYAISTAVNNAMPCHHTTAVDMTGRIYTFYEREKTKEHEEQTKKKENTSKEKNKKDRKKLPCPPAQGMWQTHEKNELSIHKKHHYS